MPGRIGELFASLSVRSWVCLHPRLVLLRTRAPGRWVYRLHLVRWNFWLEVGRGPGEAFAEVLDASEPPAAAPPAHPHPDDEEPGPGPGAAA